MRPESAENPIEEKQDPLSGKEGSDKDSGDGDASSSSSGAKNQGEGGHGVKVEEEQQQQIKHYGLSSYHRIIMINFYLNLSLFVESEHREAASATIHCNG